MSSSQYKVGCLCIPTPFFVDYWSGYWIIKNIHKDVNMSMLLITLHNLNNGRDITIPMDDVSAYFIVVSDRPKVWDPNEDG